MTAKEFCDAKNSHITREVTVRHFDESKLHIGTAYKVFQVYDDSVTGYGRKLLFNGILQSIKDRGREIVLVTSRISDPGQLYRNFGFLIDETSTMMAVTIDIENIVHRHVVIQPYYSSDAGISVDIDNDEVEMT